MRMKHFSKLDCFRNSSLTNSSSNTFKLDFLLDEVWNGPQKKKVWNGPKKKKHVELEFPKLEFLVNNFYALGTRV